MIVLLPYNAPGLVTFTLRQSGSDAFATSSHWTPAAGDVKLSLDGGTQANSTNLPTFANGQWTLSLEAMELQAARVRINIDDGDIIPESILIETYGHALAAYPTAYKDPWLGITSKITSDHGVGSYVDTGAGLDAAGVRTAVGLASANLDTQLAAIPTVAPLTPTDFNNAIPANFKDLAITASTGRVTVGTNVDKTGYTLTDMDVNVVNVAGAAVSSINDFKSNPLTQGQTEAAVATALAAYNTAKIGSAMTLTPGERDAVAVEVESHLLDEGDSQPLIDAIVQAIGNTNVDELVLVAAIRSELERAGGNLNTLLTRLTSDRAGFLDKLNVTGTLANTNNADTFKADVSGLLTTVQFVNSLPANFDTLVIDVNGEVTASNMVSEPPTIGDFQTAVEDGLTAYDAPNRTDISNIPGGGGGSGASAAEIWTYWPRTLTPPDDPQNPSIVAHRHAGTLYQGFDYLSSGNTQLSLMEQTPSEWDKDIIDIGGLKLHLRNVQTGHSVTVPATSTYNSTSQIHTLKAELDSSQIPTKTGLYKGFFYASSSGTGSPTDYFLITTFSVNVEQGISNC